MTSSHQQDKQPFHMWRYFFYYVQKCLFNYFIYKQLCIWFLFNTFINTLRIIHQFQLLSLLPLPSSHSFPPNLKNTSFPFLFSTFSLVSLYCLTWLQSWAHPMTSHVHLACCDSLLGAIFLFPVLQQLLSIYGSMLWYECSIYG